MPEIRLDAGDAAGLAETLTFLPGASDSEELSGEPCHLPTSEGNAP